MNSRIHEVDKWCDRKWDKIRGPGAAGEEKGATPRTLD
jgi:hypothetical protein